MTEEARDEIRQWLRDQLILEHKRMPLFREAMNKPRIYCGIIGLRTVNDEEKAEDIVFPVHLDEVEILAECYEKTVAHRINELKARLENYEQDYEGRHSADTAADERGDAED